MYILYVLFGFHTATGPQIWSWQSLYLWSADGVNVKPVLLWEAKAAFEGKEGKLEGQVQIPHPVCCSWRPHSLLSILHASLYFN